MTEVNIPPDHPRAKSLLLREKLISRYLEGVVAASGLIAHGRGEAFDYLLNERTSKPALGSIEAAAAMLLAAEKSVISVNGNTAALVSDEIVKLAKVVGAKVEVNLFYRSVEREVAIKRLLEEAGAKEVLGVGERASARIPELGSERRRVDPRGIMTADVVLVMLEDGDRTEALVKMGKRVIAVDLNPLSRTAQRATVTIVDNIVRAAPRLLQAVERLKKRGAGTCRRILGSYDNEKNLTESIAVMNKNLSAFAEKRRTPQRAGRMK